MWRLSPLTLERDAAEGWGEGRFVCLRGSLSSGAPVSSTLALDDGEVSGAKVCLLCPVRHPLSRGWSGLRRRFLSPPLPTDTYQYALTQRQIRVCRGEEGKKCGIKCFRSITQ